MHNQTMLVILYDYYSELFTEKQQKYFEDYYFNNFTLKEISENNNVSRNAIHKQIKEVHDKLNYYEDKLGLYKKREKLDALLKNIDDDELKSKIEKII